VEKDKIYMYILWVLMVYQHVDKYLCKLFFCICWLIYQFSRNSCILSLSYIVISKSGLVTVKKQTVFFSKSIIQHINTFSVYGLTFPLFPFYLYNFIPLNTSNLQTNLLCHCVMFISVICHVTRDMWPIELVINNKQ